MPRSPDRTGEEWVAAAEARLKQQFDLIHVVPGPNPAPILAIKPPLDPLEAEYFLKGLDMGIFSIDDEGYVQSTMLPWPSPKSKRQKILQLFWRPAKPYLFREGVCQISTAAAFALKFGCPLDQIKMEPTFPGRPWSVDILLKSPQGLNVAFCEVKRDDRELSKLISGFRYCCEAGQRTTRMRIAKFFQPGLTSEIRIVRRDQAEILHRHVTRPGDLFPSVPRCGLYRNR